VCFIKEIRRARKKGFFVTLEDVTWVIDVFLKEKLDYKVFDVVILSAYKWHRLSVNRIETVALQSLRDEVKRKGLYDASMTASYVKMMRNKKIWEEEVDQQESKLSVSSNDVKVVDWINKIDDIIQWGKDSTVWSETIDDAPLDFIMPDTIPWMVAVRKILSQFDWGDCQITLSRKSYSITPEWVQKLKELLL
jgi:hypothetical protein